jgi:hypothetical protein
LQLDSSSINLWHDHMHIHLPTNLLLAVDLAVTASPRMELQ